MSGSGEKMLVSAAIAATVFATAGARSARADSDAMSVLVPKSVGLPNGGVIAAYAYDPTNNQYWVVGFGAGASPAADMRRITNNPNGTQTSTKMVQQSEWLLFMRDGDPNRSGGVPTVSGMLFNPQPVETGAGAVPSYGNLWIVDNAAIIQGGSPATFYYNLTKKFYRYNLQSVPAAAVPPPPYGDGRDVFTPVLTKQQYNNALNGNNAPTGTTSGSSDGIARQFTWSGDGQSIYFVDTSNAYGGIWKLNPVSGAAVRMVTDTTLKTGEPSVLRLESGADRIVYQAGNSSVAYTDVDPAGAVLGSGSLFSEPQIKAFLESSVTGSFTMYSSATDADGNLYFNIGTSANLVMYRMDQQGRLNKVTNTFERQSAFGSNVITGLRMQTRGQTYSGTVGGSPVSFPVTQVMYMEPHQNISIVAGINVFTPGDFNRNGVVDAGDGALSLAGGYQDDLTLFKSALGLRGSLLTLPADNAKTKFDMNGNGGVDWKDVKVLQQFRAFSDGDVNIDGSVDSTDLSTLATSYGTSGKVWTQGNLASARVAAADKDDVNFADLVTLAANWHDQKPPLAPAGNIPQGDVDRAFAISNNGTVSQYQAKGSGAWSNAANWTLGGVPNGAGAVASLLTKPQDDTTVTVDGDYTVGQLNFDNYFTYTLSGPGTLHLNNGNVTRPAEVNAFAASPVISAGVAVESDTTVTVTYAADTLTLAGPLTVSAGKTLTKAGAGTLKVTAANTVAGKLALNAGTLEIAADTTVGGFTQGDGTLVLSGAGTELTVAPHAPGDPSDTITLAALTVPAGTTLDLSNNNLVVNSTANAAAILAALKAAYHGGAWDGTSAVTGLITSEVLAVNHDSGKTLAFRSTGAQVQVKYTWYGDLNFDGAVDAADVALMTGSADLNYDGLLSADDWALLALGASKQDGSIAAGVPEPTAATAIAGAAALGTLRRRRSL